MKRLIFSVIFLMLLVYSAAPPSSSAGNGRTEAHGNFEFTLDDGVERSVKFHAKKNNDGSVTGDMTYSDPGEIPQDEESLGPTQGVSAKISFDCLKIDGNKAVMSGVVAQSTVGALLGRRVLLVVEDNGEGFEAPDRDKLSWGVYRPTNRTWTPRDAEVEGDEGWLLNWLATDFERENDAGIPGRPSEVIGCQTFPLSSYAFINVAHGNGNIQVKP